jgi:hypothetical protein
MVIAGSAQEITMTSVSQTLLLSRAPTFIVAIKRIPRYLAGLVFKAKILFQDRRLEKAAFRKQFAVIGPI